MWNAVLRILAKHIAPDSQSPMRSLLLRPTASSPARQRGVLAVLLVFLLSIIFFLHLRHANNNNVEELKSIIEKQEKLINRMRDAMKEEEKRMMGELQPADNTRSITTHHRLNSFTRSLMANPAVDLQADIQRRTDWARSMAPHDWMQDTKDANSIGNFSTPPRDLKHFHRYKNSQLGEIGAIELGWLSRWSYYGDNDARFDMMGPIVTKCDLDSFASGDDEKRFCRDGMPATDSPTCVVYSIGSQNKWGFEIDVAKRTKCKIYTFDCTTRPVIPYEIHDRVTFFKTCIAGSNRHIGSREFVTYEDLVKMTGGQRPDLLKIDIEGWEWEVVPNIIASSRHVLETTGKDVFPVQITIEFHLVTAVMLSWMGRDKDAGEVFSFFNHLWLMGGYGVLSRRPNLPVPATRSIGCRFCQEVVLGKLWYPE